MFYIAERNSGNALKRIKIRKVGDPWCTDHCDINDTGFLLPVKTLRQAVLILHLDIQIRRHTHHRDPASFLKHDNTRVQNSLISAEFVDDQPLYHSLLIVLQKLHRTDQLSKNTSTVNISHKKDRCLGHLCHTHIYNILILEIDLGRTSSTFDDNDIVFRCKSVVCLHHIRNQGLLIFEIIPGTHGSKNFSVYDHLGAYIIGRLQKDRIHQDRRPDPGCLCLHDLGPSHLKTILCDKGIQCHIL